MKTCTKCNLEKPYEDFHKDKKARDGHVWECKSCVRVKTRKHYIDNKQEVARKCRLYVQNNPDKTIERRQRNYQENKKKVSEHGKKYYQENKDKVDERNRVYREANRERLNRAAQDRANERRKTDPFFKLIVNLRRRLLGAIKVKRWKKNSHFRDYIGCSQEELLNHLQTQFKPGMTWENHGKWHVDHIMPLASAKSEEEIITLCHYKNLQPLWAVENLKKGDKIISLEEKNCSVLIQK